MLVNCVAYRDGRKVADIPVTKIREFIGHPDGFVWVAIADPEAAELEYLQGEFDLHPLAVEDARNGHQRPKIEEYGDSLFVVLHMLEIEGPDLRVGEVAIFVGARYVLSVRSGVRRGFSDVRVRSEREPELLRHGAAYVLYALMDAVVDRYFPIVDSLEDEIEEVEGHIFAGQTTRANIESLYDLKRKLMVLKHAAGPLTEATGKLQAGRVPPVCAGPARLLQRRLRPPEAAEPVDRQPARHRHHGHHRQPLAHHAAGERGHQAAGRLRGAGRRADDDRRRVRDELRPDARAAAGPMATRWCLG